MRRIIPLLIILTVILVLSAYLDIPMMKDLRPLGEFYLKNSFEGPLSARSPEAVSAILWDYRGLDTLFETSVFFLAIIGSLMLFEIKKVKETRTEPLTSIVKDVTKISAIMICAVSASLAFHGHLTPGGGFQGGSTLAVAPLLLLAAYSRKTLEENGLTEKRAIVIRSLALMGISLAVMIPLFFGGFIMQNQPIFPATVGNSLISGSIFLYNVLEWLAIGAGFSAVFLLLAIPEKAYLEVRE